MSNDARWVDYMPLAALGSAPRNPRRHNLPELRASLVRFGIGDLPVLDERTSLLVAGHGRRDALAALEAAREQPPRYVRTDETGRWLVPVLRGWTSTDRLDAEGYLMASNRQQELSAWNFDGLVDLLGDQDDYSGLGWTQDEIERLIDPPLPGGTSTEDTAADTPDEQDDEHTAPDPASNTSRWPDFGLLIVCEDAPEQNLVLEDLRAQGYTVRPIHS